jgi:hypothetical protein
VRRAHWARLARHAPDNADEELESQVRPARRRRAGRGWQGGGTDRGRLGGNTGALGGSVVGALESGLWWCRSSGRWQRDDLGNGSDNGVTCTIGMKTVTEPPQK